MTLIEKIDADYIKAYKAKEMDRVGVLRLLKAAVKNRLVDLKRPGGTLDDEEMLDVLLRQAKQREDSIEQYQAAARQDLADKEKSELIILQEYLPAKISQAELIAIIDDIIKNTESSGPQAMGKVIGAIMNKYKGQVDGKDVSRLVKERLSN